MIGSFSKTISASARCGYVVARPEWIEGLIDLKIATSFGGGRLNAELVFAVLRDGGYRKHIEALRNRLAAAKADVVSRLRAIGIEPWLMPDAGMMLWCQLPDGVDAADLARAALAENVVLAPGNAFSVSQSAGNFMRFNVSQMADERIFDVLRRCLLRLLSNPHANVTGN
jgi:DNA-binding transcriptional MocR family regulator